jgi:hypothetical protein
MFDTATFMGLIFPIFPTPVPTFNVGFPDLSPLYPKERGLIKVYLSVPLPIAYHSMPKWWMCTTALTRTMQRSLCLERLRQNF